MGEVRAQLYVALDQAYIEKVRCQEMIGKAKEISRLIAGLLKYLQESRVG